MKDWFTVNELARIQGVTPRAIRKGVANNKYVVRQVNGKKGLMYEIFVPALKPPGPDFATTLWQGIIKRILFLPAAIPTALGEDFIPDFTRLKEISP